MVICEACGTENRDKARFCLGCAKALASTPVAAAAAAETSQPEKQKPSGPVQTCPACQAENPLAATVCKSCKASLLPEWTKPVPAAGVAATGSSMPKALVIAGLVFAGLAAAAWWMGSQGRDSLAQDASPAAAPAIAATPAPSMATVSATTTLPETTSATLEAEAAAEAAAATKATRAKKLAAERERKQRLAREERDRLAALEQQRAEQAQEQQRAEQAKRRAEQQAARDKAAEKAAAASAQAVATVKTVEQSCASSGNFFAREACKVKTCGDPAFAKDPVCVRFRQTEAENRKALRF